MPDNFRGPCVGGPADGRIVHRSDGSPVACEVGRQSWSRPAPLRFYYWIEFAPETARAINFAGFWKFEELSTDEAIKTFNWVSPAGAQAR